MLGLLNQFKSYSDMKGFIKENVEGEGFLEGLFGIIGGLLMLAIYGINSGQISAVELMYGGSIEISAGLGHYSVLFASILSILESSLFSKSFISPLSTSFSLSSYNY